MTNPELVKALDENRVVGVTQNDSENGFGEDGPMSPKIGIRKAKKHSHTMHEGNLNLSENETDLSDDNRQLLLNPRAETRSDSIEQTFKKNTGTS